jgi:hypothetical protein
MQIHGKTISEQLKNNIKKLLVILLTAHCSLLTIANADSGVTAKVNTQEVVKGDLVELQITAEGGAAAFPDISQIAGVGVSRSWSSKSSSTSITSAGIKSINKTIYTYLFVPQHDMVIPSYTVNISGKKYTTKAIPIKVVHAQAPSTSSSRRYSMLLTSDKQAVTVGESFVVTMFLTISEQMGRVQISNMVEPTSSDFFLKNMGKERQYKKARDTVLEMRYMATAKEKGNFIISPAKVQLGLEDRSRQDIFGRYGVRWMSISSNALNIAVQEQAKQTDLVGDFSLNQKVDTQKVKANKPVNLSVKIDGKGSLEDFVFPEYNIDGVTVYSDEAKVESRIVGEVLVSSYAKSFAFIAEEDFVIPQRNISVYDPATKKEKILTVKQYDVKVEKKKVSVNSSTTKNVVQTNLVEEDIEKESVLKKTVEVKTTNWWKLALAFGLGMLAMYLTSFLTKFKKEKNPYKEAEALKILYAHISEGKEVEEMVRKLYARKNGDSTVRIDKKELKEMVQRFK